MRFMLQVRGPLPAVRTGKGRGAEKHQIRLQIHRQLKELWAVSPALAGFRDAESNPRTQAAELKADQTGLWRLHAIPRKTEDYIGDISYASSPWRSFALAGRTFVPFITYHPPGWLCQLDIRFLRRGQPGRLVDTGTGDIDNRIKLLLDALRMPKQKQELFTAGEYPAPCFCLLEDDALIASLSVTSQTLLETEPEGQRQDHAVLFIEVHIESTGYTR